MSGRSVCGRTPGMSPPEMAFSGLKHPQMDVPLIELETPDGQVLDLYNDHSLSSLTIRADELTFEFASSDRGVVLVRFAGVRHLRVEQPADWDPGEASDIDHLLVRTSGPWRRIAFKAGGLEYEFDCDELLLVV